MPVLDVGSTGARVKVLQRSLNRLGLLLLVDGDFGSGTRTAVADARRLLARPGGSAVDDAFLAVLRSQPHLDRFLLTAGATFIARAEVTSAALYRRLYERPTWPGGKSGVTIGIGYDLRFASPATLRADWGAVLGTAALAALEAQTGRVGSRARARAVETVRVPLAGAMSVFVARSLPKYIGRTRDIYPQLDALPAARRAALVGLVYNRGKGLTDRSAVKQERREMRRIQALLAQGRLDDVAPEFEKMTRLWENQGLEGLIKRRLDEARLWRAGFTALQLA